LFEALVARRLHRSANGKEGTVPASPFEFLQRSRGASARAVHPVCLAVAQWFETLECRRLLSTVYASDLPFAHSTNGWGPVERDMDTGGQAANDGNPIVVGGVPFARGLGVHAPSEVVFDLNGDYDRFLSHVGISDTWGNHGSVEFQVFADGTKIYDSGIMTGADAASTLDVDVSGIAQLRLVVTPGPDGFAYDHAVWAGARFETASPQSGPPAAPSHLAAVASSSSLVKLSWWDHSSNETGFRVERSAGGSPFVTIATVNDRDYDDADVQASTTYAYRVIAFNGDGDSTPATVSVATPAPPPPGNFLSDLPFVSSTNAWGPVERDMDTGGQAANDGNPIVIGGVPFAKGLGMHAPSEVVFDLDGEYARFKSAVGISDTWGNNGSVVFQVFADGVKIHDSGLKTGADTAGTVDVDVSGVEELRLVVTAGPDGFAYDHAVWGDARVETAPPAPGLPNSPSNLAANTTSASTVKLTWQDHASNEIGFRVERSTDGSVFTTIATLGVNDRDFDDTNVSASTTYTYRVVAFNADGDSTPVTVSVATPPPSDFLSDLPFVSSTNEWGPVERDKDNGGNAANDGNPIVVNGVGYAKGLGVHAYSEVAFNFGGGYTWFRADIGISDTWGNNGSVVFQVFGDGAKLYESPLITGASASIAVEVDVEGVEQLKLVVTPGPDGAAYDHAVWANARAEQAPPPQPVAPKTPTALAAVATSDESIALSWRDKSNNESSFEIERSTNGTDFEVIATLPANQRAYLDTGLDPSSTYIYRVRASNEHGTSAPSSVAAGTTLQHSVFLSDLPFASSTNGWGPVERDMDTGGQAANDGNPLVIGGVPFAKGLGVHAPSEVTFDLDGRFERFVSSVGISDTWGNTGSVVFQVFADGTKIYDSGLMTGADSARTVDIDVTGVALLRLVVTTGPDGFAYDHAVWAGARVLYAPEPTAPHAASGLKAATPSSTEVVLTWHDHSAVETGFRVERSTDGVNFTQIAVLARNVESYRDLSVEPMHAYSYRVAAYNSHGDSAFTQTVTVTTPPNASDIVYLSDLPFVTAINEFGPVERDTNNGDEDAGDGSPIVLDGVTYARGLGVHGYSEVTFNLNGNYARFMSDVGVDDSVSGHGKGMLIFRVYGDGVLIYDSSTMTSDTPTKALDVSVVGIDELKLVVLDAGDGVINDLANWANARLVLASPGVPLLPAAPLSAIARASGSSIELNWSDTSTNELGFRILRSTSGVHFAEIATVAANTHTFVDATAVAQVKYTYRVVAFNASGASAPSGGAVAITGVTYLSDLPFVSETNGWGPVERDMSTGHEHEGDGETITLSDVSYSKGLGVHPMLHDEMEPAAVVFDLNGQYSRFQSDIGVNDYYGILGSVVFKVYADGVLIFESSIMTGTSATQSIDLDMTGVHELKLVVTPTADHYYDDHAVWAGARLL
jgi:hypothetical protein